MPAGKATIAIPNRDEIMVMILPIVEVAYISPYPTVVSEMVAQYTASKKLLNVPGSALKMTSADIRI